MNESQLNIISNNQKLPLADLRVLDMCDVAGASSGRYLADLGADVILVEPPQGLKSRSRAPLHNDESLFFATHHANKRSVQIDLATVKGKQQFYRLIENCDILLDGYSCGPLEDYGMGPETLHESYPDLLILSISDFGLHGPYKDFRANDAVHTAMGCLLSRSGVEGHEPLLPPGELAYETAGIQAAWVALLSYWQRKHTGQGDHLDFSINDAVAQVLDPGVGAAGSAAAGKSPIEVAIHGRSPVVAEPGKLPSVASLYPIFKCADGYVRICILNPGQWRAISEWIGDSNQFKGPQWEGVKRMIMLHKINPMYANFFKDKNRHDIEEEGRKRGIPLAALSQPNELFDSEHFAARGFFKQVSIANSNGSMPTGYLRIDNYRVGLRESAPTKGENTEDVSSQWSPRQAKYGNEDTSRRPLNGLLVLDLGVIVAGAETGRLFADQGATVIKVENAQFRDGLRQSRDNNPAPISFSQGNRNKRSMGINLRSPKGKEIFKRLVAKADVVLSNFKPGTMESLGFSYEELSSINPRIICAESSAQGSVGPNAKTMGYGPLVRASTSLTGLWRYPEQADGFADSVTIYPDHFAARVSATAILAKVIQREKTGKGGFIDLAQAECIMNALSTEFLRESLQPGTMVAKGNRSEFFVPSGVFQCRGKDEWAVLSIETDEQWVSLCNLMNRQDLANDARFKTNAKRLEHRIELETETELWCSQQSPIELRDKCQSKGIAVGNMLRLKEFVNDPHYLARSFFRKLYVTTVGREFATENGPVSGSRSLPEPALNPAPVLGEHTKELAREFLNMADQEIESLIESGDLQVAKRRVGGVYKQKLQSIVVDQATKVILGIEGVKSRLGR